MDFPPGVLGILSGELARYSGFSQSVLGLQLPPGTRCTWITGHWIATAVNRIFRSMPPEAEWTCLLADDHRCSPNMILRLLSHQVDIVAPLCPLRFPPYPPAIFHPSSTGAGVTPYTWAELDGKTGLLPVDIMAGPGMLIQRKVLEKVGDPWFESMPGERESPKEDLYFSHKCHEAGFQSYVDLDCWMTHYFPGELAPIRDSQGRYAVEVCYEAQRLGILRGVPDKAQSIPTYHAYT